MKPIDMREKMSDRERQRDSKTLYTLIFFVLNWEETAKLSCPVASVLMPALSISEFMSPRNILISEFMPPRKRIQSKLK